MSEWQLKRLDELAEIRISNVDKLLLPGELHVQLCNYMDVYIGRYLAAGSRYMEATCTARELAAFGLRRGDVIITKDSESPDDIAIPAMIDDDVEGLVCGYHLAILRTRSELIDPVVLLKQLESERLRRYFGQRASGSTRYGLSARAIARAPILVPPLDVQRTIVQTHRSLDAQIEHIEALTAKQEQVRAGLMQDLFTRGIDKTGRLRPPREEVPDQYHKTKLGWLPKGWAAVRVQEIAHVVRGSTPRPAKDPRYFDGTFVPWVTVGELSRDDWPYLETTSSKLTELGARFSRLLPSDTLTISNSGYGCGVPKILKLTGCANDGIAALLELSKQMEQLFLYYWFYQNIEIIRTRFARGNDQPNLNTDIIGNLLIPRPALSEQKIVADRIWCVQQVMEQQRRETAKLRHLRTALLRDLLTPPTASTAPLEIAAE